MIQLSGRNYTCSCTSYGRGGQTATVVDFTHIAEERRDVRAARWLVVKDASDHLAYCVAVGGSGHVACFIACTVA